MKERNGDQKWHAEFLTKTPLMNHSIFNAHKLISGEQGGLSVPVHVHVCHCLEWVQFRERWFCLEWALFGANSWAE